LKLAYQDMDRNTDEVKNAIERNQNDSLKSDANLLQEISQTSNEIKAVEKKFEQISAMFGGDLKVQQDKVELLEKTVAKLEENLKNCENQDNVFDQSNRTVQQEVEDKPLRVRENPVKNQVELVQVSEVKLLLENERLQFKLEKQAMDFELKSLKQELADLRMESERRDAEMKALKDQFVKFEMSMRP
jgi:hypothetical protein